MELAFDISVLVSIAAFLFYGLACLFTGHMAQEFERYGLARWRRLTGGLEVAGALGLLVGYFVPPLVVAASFGLTLLMILGLVTRLRVHDPLPAMLPAFVLGLVNGYVFAVAAGLLG